VKSCKHTTSKRRGNEKSVTKQNPLAYAAEYGRDCTCSNHGIMQQYNNINDNRYHDNGTKQEY
jgi:hypothetical protein